MNDRAPGYGTVLGIAGAAAGVVGTLAAVLMDRDSAEDPREKPAEQRRQEKVESRPTAKAPGRFRKKNEEPPPPELDPGLQRVSEVGAQIASLTASGIGAAKSRIESGDLQLASRQLATTLKDRSRDRASRAGSLGSDVSTRASGLVSEARNQMPGLVDAAGKAAIDARNRGAQLGIQALERLPEVRGQVENRVTPVIKDLRKQASPLLGEATAAASSILGTAESRARGARLWAEKDALPEVRIAVADVTHKAAERAKSAEVRVASVSAGATGTLSAVEDRTRHAASVAAQGTKDTGAIVFWGTVAGGLVFYALLSDAQRERVKAAALRIGSEAKEIYRDVQGYDEEFS